jgi:hypothetical protein
MKISVFVLKKEAIRLTGDNRHAFIGSSAFPDPHIHVLSAIMRANEPKPLKR